MTKENYEKYKMKYSKPLPKNFLNRDLKTENVL